MTARTGSGIAHPRAVEGWHEKADPLERRAFRLFEVDYEEAFAFVGRPSTLRNTLWAGRPRVPRTALSREAIDRAAATLEQTGMLLAQPDHQHGYTSWRPNKPALTTAASRTETPPNG
jgi:hypothetical protein